MALTVSNGVLLLDGQTIRHVGVNAAYLLARRWFNASDTQHIETIDNLADLGVKVVRCFAIPNITTSGGLITWGTATGLDASFYTAQDVVWDYAETKGIKIIACLFPNYWSIANYKSEKLDQLGVSGSDTRDFMRTCAAEYVAHYASHNALGAWEITNEWNSYAELSIYPDGNDYTGNPYSSDAQNLITVPNFIEAIADIANTIRANDATTAILSGNAGPWNVSVAALDGYEGILQRFNPDPINTISLHIYSYPTNNVWCRQGFAPLGDIIGAAKKVARHTRKPMITGEIGVSSELSTYDSDYDILMQHLGSAEAPQLSLLWNFYKPGSTLPSSNPNYDFWVTGDRSKFADKVREFAQANLIFDLEKNSADIPTKWAVFTGTQCAYRPMPTIDGNMTLSFWARTGNTWNNNFPRMVSATSDESTNGFIVLHLPNSASGREPYFRVFTSTGGQSATTRSGALQDWRWKHWTYVFKYWTRTFTADAASDQLTLATAVAKMQTGDIVRFTTTGTLPAGLTTGVDYAVIRVSDTVVKVATGQSNAYLGTAINITDAGSGTHTVTCRFLSVYQNGLQATTDTTTTFTGAWVNPTGNFVIGADRTAANNFFRGHLAKVRLWDRGLTQLEAWQNYVGLVPSGALSYLVDDFSGLTTVGSPVFEENASPTSANLRFVTNNRPLAS